MKKAISMLTLVTLTISAGGGVLAHDGDYAVGGNGKALRDGQGDCVITPYHGQDLSGCNPAPTPPPVVQSAPKPVTRSAPKPVRVEKKLTLAGGAYFATNSDKLTQQGKNSLDKLVLDLRRLTVDRITVTGHTDDSGDKGYNQVLSERRASTVKNYLIEKGINESKIWLYGRGETDPVASNATKSGRAENRRVDISISATKVTYR